MTPIVPAPLLLRHLVRLLCVTAKGEKCHARRCHAGSEQARTSRRGTGRHTGLDPTISDILKSAYSNESSALILNNMPTKTFKVEKGVRQGACSLPILFNLLPDQLAKLLKDVPVGIALSDGTQVNCLLYADDIALIAKSAQELQILADNVTIWAEENRLQINADKTEYLALTRNQAGTIRLAG